MHGTTVRDKPVSSGPKNAGKENVSKDRERTKKVASKNDPAVNWKDSRQICEISELSRDGRNSLQNASKQRRTIKFLFLPDLAAMVGVIHHICCWNRNFAVGFGANLW